MRQHQKDRYLELISKLEPDEISELISLFQLEQSIFAKQAILDYREYAWKNGSTLIDAHKFIKENGI